MPEIPSPGGGELLPILVCGAARAEMNISFLQGLIPHVPTAKTKKNDKTPVVDKAPFICYSRRYLSFKNTSRPIHHHKSITTTLTTNRPHLATMLPSLRLLALAALCTLPYAARVASSPVDGPNKLDECTSCVPIYTAMVKCQKIKRPGGIGKEITDCICIPNSKDDAWYGYIHKCRDCLVSGNSDFFNNLASMMTQLLTSCTNAGGNVVSDGESICASNAMWNECASLKNGGESWASFVRFSDSSQNSNATQVLSLAAVGKGSASTTGAGSSTSLSAASTTDSETGSPSTTATTKAAGTGVQVSSSTTGSQSATATTGGPSSATSSSATSSSAAGLSYGPRAGSVWGMLGAAGLVGLLA